MQITFKSYKITDPVFVFQVIDGTCGVMAVWPSDKVRTYVGLGLITLQMIIPFIVLIICYGKIVWVLTRKINSNLMKSQSALEKSQNCSDPSIEIRDPSKDKFQLARKNTIKTLIIVACCFIICWTQNQIIVFLFNVDMT